ncbi:unnamed protein product [Blepharisma stoltei]|uniref:Uncharacterized protein n=1 Tax=Blepharisma stoltei TaxID=1481888 RepID=A0AAU9JMG3_9CILI|nr:unnamed protein product [Blepharisma stoltei]
MASNSQFQTERKKAFEETKKLNIRFQRAQEDILDYGDKLWELHMDCYMDGKDKCVQMYNQAFLQWNKLRRRKADAKNCIKKCDELKDPTSRIKKDILNEKHLECYKRAHECARQCTVKAFDWLGEEQEFLRKSLEKMREEFYPTEKK